MKTTCKRDIQKMFQKNKRVRYVRMPPQQVAHLAIVSSKRRVSAVNVSLTLSVA